MTFTGIIHDPLAINLRQQTLLLLSNIPPNTLHYDALQNAFTTRQLLATLSSLLTLPRFTQLIATLFRPILLDLCVRWIENEDVAEDAIVALCYLLEVHEELFPVLNQILLKHYKNGPLAFISGSLSCMSISITQLHRLLLAYYRILQANRELPNYLLWSLEPLSILIWTPRLDNAVRLLAIRCYTLQSGMGEEERLKLEREVLGEPCGVDCQLNYDQNIAGEEQEIDGWVMPVIELKRTQEARENIAVEKMDYFSQEGNEEMPSLAEDDLCSCTVNVHGVILLRSSSTASVNSALIPLPSSIDALRQLALNISSHLPTLVTSAPSAGKALLISHLSGLLHPEIKNQIVTIHLADTSLDPRGLLGAYVSSTIRPGTFDWKEGVLVRSMREGRWVVFEDIDRGSNEVLGVIKPLIESMCTGKWIGGRAQLSVPGRGTIIAHNDFMLFATRSIPLGRNGTFHPPTFFGSHKLSEVIVQSPSVDELCTIVTTKFPRLGRCAGEAAVNLWQSVLKLGSQSSGWDVGIRELLKFCQRIDKILPSYQAMDIDSGEKYPSTLVELFPNPSLREDMYLETRDVFFGAGTTSASSRAHSKAIAKTTGDQLGLDSDRQKWVLQGKLPEIETEKDVNGRTVALHLGRTRLPALPTNGDAATTPARPFAMHKPAVMLLSRISNAIAHGEPVLLTGETGTGKTSVVSHLASLVSRPLISLNLSHQTESSDLIGGLKPIDARIPGSALQEKFLALFGATFSRRKNEKFEAGVRKAVNECKWKRAVGLWKESVRLAMGRIQAKQIEDEPSIRNAVLDDEAPRKRRKMDRVEPKSSEHGWATFLSEVEDFDVQHVHGKGKFAFGFVEGPLIKAIRSGAWVLLDEVNLASPETLESLSGLLDSPTASITLTEHGSLEPIPRHPDFRLFACMNPATDVGKKDLPPAIRTRFTEIDVPPPDSDKDTLLSIISQYIGHIAISDKRIIMDIAEFYFAVKTVAESRQIADGTNHRPHFSMRTLVRALTFAADTASGYSLRRSVWEGCLMAFTMVLDATSAEIVTGLARKHLLSGVRNPRSLLSKDPVPPMQGAYVKFGPFYIEKGPLDEIAGEDYIMTPSVEQKLIDLARIILTRRFPVLIEGPTSSGKTSSIEYLAKRTGHCFVRINNHEHTDIQEYLGSYVSDPLTGKLVFKDGLLVQALRLGHWIVLDELNLAPTDVLEALNRLLDDNRELVIPETQEVIRPHPHFMLFATQNPPGLYAGRKVLSRAFRNRFLEVHFENVPQNELETILCRRCQIAPSYGKKIVAVFHELQKRRQTSRVFESKHGFATLRDLFRWAGRQAMGYQELAEDGFMLLAERTRRLEDKEVVKEVIESIMNVKIDEDAMYDLFRPGRNIESYLGHALLPTSEAVWTKAMQRLYTLVCRGLKFNEPVLLVGETGSGKTSVCQVFAEASTQRLLALNCHQNTETADLIGGLRPVRNRSHMQTEIFWEVSLILKELGLEVNPPTTLEASDKVLSSLLNGSLDLDGPIRQTLEALRSKALRLNSIFEWYDGPLIEAMCNGDVFLLDEISLADDSVLERLNSVLEPGRSIVLAERGGTESAQPAIRASCEFKLIATMNPGGDYGKKELSPALRNRFTEIWVPQIDERKDLELIVNSLWRPEALRSYTSALLDFVEWLCLQVGDRSVLSLRDILAWVVFTNSAYKQRETNGVSGEELFHHAAHMTYLDGLSSFPQLAGYSREVLTHLKADASAKLQELVPLPEPMGFKVPAYDTEKYVQLGSFAIPRGVGTSSPQQFNFAAPTSLDNAMRVIRACQVPKPILLEGSPGVGKTSLITALAKLSGHHLCRINLSDQTDLIDLLGSDLPVEGGSAGEFAWKDAEFLKALQDGHWVLLDEMNLAPQAVLEGLNAILDHRGTVYIPELNRSFKQHPDFRVFAAQNPLHQGSGRKGLPKSFVNRFTKVYIEELNRSDLYTVCSHIFPDIDEGVLRAMIDFNIQLNECITVKGSFAQEGSPWEFNLRDVIRWGTLSTASKSNRDPRSYIQSVYLQRFRNPQDRKSARALFDQIFCTSSEALENQPPWILSENALQIGNFTATRRNFAPLARPCRILKSQLSALESLGHCISQSYLAILTGPKNSGKTNIIRALANFVGVPLWEVSINNATDTMDILGSFEQVDTRKRLLTVLNEIIELLEQDLRLVVGSKTFSPYWVQAQSLKRLCERSSTLDVTNITHQIHILVSKLATSPSASNSSYRQIESSLDRRSISATGQFEWVDGPLVKAMKSGQWLLLDGANLCGPSVLDRLNSLCESGGSLTLSERGFVDGNVQTIIPHPDFRLIMSVDPHHGELSRAMRNRGIEISLSPIPLADDNQIICHHLRLPLALSSAGSNAQSTLFHAARRGVIEIQSSESHVHHSTGRYFDQDSALANIVDQVPHLLSTVGGTNDSAWISVLSKTLIPAYMPFATRYFTWRSPRLNNTLSDFLYKFPKNITNTALLTSRDTYANLKGILLKSLSQKPMYFYWNEEPADTIETRELSCRTFLLEILNLGSALTIYEHNGPLDLAQNKYSSKEKDQQAREAVVSLYDEIVKVASVVLSTAYPALELDLRSLKLASSVLSYSGYLRKAVALSAPDFSALHAICNWILANLDNCSPLFLQLFHRVQTLGNVISLSTGLGLFDLWSGLHIDNAPQNLIETMVRTNILSSSLVKSANASAIRSQAFNVLALESLPSILKSCKPAALSEIRANLDECISSNTNVLDLPTDRVWAINSSMVILEMNALALWSVSGDKQLLNDITHEIVSITCQTQNASLLRVIPYQHLLWTFDVGTASASLLAKAQMQWMDGLWNLRLSTSDLSGPGVLLHPISLHNTISICDMDQVELRTLTQHEVLLRQQAHLAIVQSKQASGRASQLYTILLQSATLIASVYESSFDPATYREIKEVAGKVTNEFLQTFHKFTSLLMTSNNSGLVTAVKKEILPLQAVMTGRTPLQVMGLAWVGLSRLLSNLVVPDTPMDPAAVHNCYYDRLQHECDDLKAQIALHQKLEVLLTGNEYNDFIRNLYPQLEKNCLELANLPVLPDRNNIARLHLFWSEVLQFQQTVLPASKTDPLLAALLRGDEQAGLREQVMQESLEGFYQRLDAVYPEFVDISNLLKLAILYMRLGMRTVAESTSLALSSNTTGDFASALISFPTISSSDHLLSSSQTVDPANAGAFRHVLLTLSAISVENAVGINNNDHLEVVQRTYEQAIGLWHIDRAKEKKQTEEASTLYRTVDYNAATDVEIEEEEFLSLFPTFEGALDADHEVKPTIKTPSSVLVRPEDMSTLLCIHYNLTGISCGSESYRHDRIFSDIRGTLVQELMRGSLGSLPGILDEVGIPFQFNTLHDCISSIDDTKRSLVTSSYNFYSDPNYTELKKASSIVEALRQRLTIISQEWPDQMVVQHLIERCDTILAMNSKTSIAKAISMLEQLLTQSQDWEMYSNRHNSIKVHQEEMVRLMVGWRGLELACWQSLLDSQAKTFTEDLAAWWFRLYDAIIRGTLSIIEEGSEDSQNLDRYLETLIPLLDDFITSSPLGQFESRMRLVYSFEQYIALVIPSKSMELGAALQRIARILNASHCYYNLFTDFLRQRLSKEKGVLEKEVKSFIKLASWKDVNVQALKQSAQRTHRQLYKIVRKFRDVLRQPIAAHLQPFSAGDIESRNLTLGSVSASNPLVSFPKRSINPPVNGATAIPAHVINIKRTFDRFESLIGKRLRPFISTQSARSVDDAAVEIITTSNSLASLTVPPEESQKRREKHRKALLVRKRKAWADMLKELRRAGLSSTLKPEVLRQNTDQQWIREQPVLPSNCHCDIEVQRGDEYFVKLRGCMPSLRSSLSTHHSDLTTRELQRGHMLLESGFAMGIDLRSRLILALDEFIELQKILSRLEVLATVGTVIHFGENTLPHVSSVKNRLCKVSHALSELRDDAITFNKLDPSPVIAPAFFEEITSIIDVSKGLVAESGRFLDVLNSVKTPHYTQSERNMLLEADKLFVQVSEKLSVWKEYYPSLNYLLSPLGIWLDKQHVIPLKLADPQTISNGSEFELLLNSLLISVQSLATRCNPTVDIVEEESERYIIKGYQFAREFTHHLNLAHMKGQLRKTLAEISLKVDFCQLLDQILPFLTLFLSIAQDQLITHSNWMKSILKLDFVLCSLLQTLSQQGFCQPQESEEPDGNGDATEETGGVGIGDGSGNDNISKDIEDESQVEGLKGEETESNEPESKHEDGDAIEMKDDFGGALEDVEEPDDDDEAKSEGGSESEPEFDETLGDLDNLDPSAVDEKMWGDEKGPENLDDPEEKADQDHSKEGDGPSEVTAKESKEQKQSKKQPKDDKNPIDDTDPNFEEEEEAKAEEGDDDEPSDPNVNGTKMDEYVEDANTLDLPDEIELGEDVEMDNDNVKEDDLDELDEDTLDEEQGPMDDGEEQVDDSTVNDINKDVPGPNVDDNQPTDDADQNPATESDEAQKDDEKTEDDADTPPEGIVARPDLSKESGVSDPNETSAPDAGESASTGEAGTSQGGAGEAAPTDEKVADDEGSTEVNPPDPADSNEKGSSSSGAQQGGVPSQNELKPVPNPLRSLGDALQEIRQRFDEILNSTNDDLLDQPQEKLGESNNQSQVEYLQPDDADHNMQALGPAGEEQVAKLNQLSILDDEMVNNEAHLPMDIDMPLAQEQHEASREPEPQQEETAGSEHREGVEGAILQSGLLPAEDIAMEPILDSMAKDKLMEDEDQKVESQLREWRASDYPENGAKRVWRLYEAMTHDLAYTLCEQLRLILEPTMATRLKGDYRTGKRLNMKKVISYIASDYTKDKIWLRRTKPSQREYQVLISIDDSRSMAESHSVHLAYQTLALISKALSRLESGDVAIAKFGETVDLLHGFDSGPFSDQAGTKVINAFRFSQKATNILSLLETSLRVLEQARERKAMSSASAADLWQLQIVISDGICQDHEKLRTVLRRAEEQRVMIVFIILDSLQSSSSESHPGSILHMDKAEFKNVDGKMELQLQKYLDSFPFEYYVILRQVEALPEVLAGTLKQFFERISEE